jgi:hypothetical protein
MPPGAPPPRVHSPSLDKLPFPQPLSLWHTLSCGATRAAELQLWAPAVSVPRRPAQLLGLLVLREGRGCPADAQARSGRPVRSRPTTSRRPTTGRASFWTARKPTTSPSGRRLSSGGPVRLLRPLLRRRYRCPAVSVQSHVRFHRAALLNAMEALCDPWSAVDLTAAEGSPPSSIRHCP